VDVNNIALWEPFFQQHEFELARHDSDLAPPLKNLGGYERWWGMPGRTLHNAMEHIHNGGARLQRTPLSPLH
jgi:hypothetical protein